MGCPPIKPVKAPSSPFTDDSTTGEVKHVCTSTADNTCDAEPVHDGSFEASSFFERVASVPAEEGEEAIDDNDMHGPLPEAYDPRKVEEYKVYVRVIRSPLYVLPISHDIYVSW